LLEPEQNGSGNRHCNEPADAVLAHSFTLLAFGIGIAGAAHILPRIGGTIFRCIGIFFDPFERRLVLLVDHFGVLLLLLVLDLESGLLLLLLLPLRVSRAGEASRQDGTDD